jgi:hypothetical protein
MAEADVLALVGEPAMKATNPRWENKTTEEWAQIRHEAGSYADGTQLLDGSPVDLIRLRAATEMEHQIKTTWIYHPAPHTALAVYFDQNGKVLKALTFPLVHGPPRGENGQGSPTNTEDGAHPFGS